MSTGASYFGNRILRHVASDMEDLARRGFTGVLHTFSENDLNYYRDQMRCIVEVSHGVGHVRYQGGRSTVCLLPLTGGPRGLSDWSKVASMPGLGALATDPYWKAFGHPVRDTVGGFARRVRDLGNQYGVGTEIWIQGFGLGPEDVPDIHAAVDDLWTWGYEACGHMDYLGTREPEEVWAALTEALSSDGHPAQGA